MLNSLKTRFRSTPPARPTFSLEIPDYYTEGEACSRIARSGDLTLLMQCHRLGLGIDRNTLIAAAEGGHTKIFLWLATLLPLDQEIAEMVAKSGNLELVIFVYYQGYDLSSKIMENAAESRNLELLQWLVDNECPWNRNIAVDAVEAGHAELLEWVLKNSGPCPDEVMEIAAVRGSIEIIKILVKYNYIPNEKVAFIANQAGNHQLVQWLMMHGYSRRSRMSVALQK